MPRGRKKKVQNTAAVDENLIKETALTDEPVDLTAKKERKAYPSVDERLAFAEKNIERLTKLNDSRRELIEKTEKTLNERKETLEKSVKALDKEVKKREHLIELKDRANDPSPRRSVKSEEKAQVNKLLSALKESGKTVDEIMEMLNKQ